MSGRPPKIWVIGEEGDLTSRYWRLLREASTRDLREVPWNRLSESDPRGDDVFVAMLPEAWLPQAETFVSRIRAVSSVHPLAVVTDTKDRRRLRPLLDQDIDQILAAPKDVESVGRALASLDPGVTAPGGDTLRELSRRMGANPIVGKSEIFRRIVRKLPLLGRSSATLLIQGETGVGKELFARAVHYLGSRLSGPFIPVNCGGIPDHLLENELFGHVKGAFTDASSAQKGFVQEASGGTLFLDEIHALSSLAQVKLLRFMEDRMYKPLGSHQLQSLDARVVCASNTDLRQEVAEGRFRSDLYYRLNILKIEIPPLRERAEDIRELADYFVDKFSRIEDREGVYLTETALQKLCQSSWPGNVRELRNVLEKAVAMHSGTILRPGHLDIESASDEAGEGSSNSEGESFQMAKRKAIEHFEKTFISDLLRRFEGNVSQAARTAGTDRRSLQRLMRKHGL